MYLYWNRITVYAIIGREKVISTSITAYRESEKENFEPGKGIQFTTHDYTLIEDEKDEIPFTTYSGELYFSCKSDPTLPKGLTISNSKISGIPTEKQEAKEYKIVCDDLNSLSNEVTITIAVEGQDVLIPGIGAYYMKMTSPSDNCFGLYEPGDKNVNLRVQRIDSVIDYEEGDGVWEGLGSEMTVPFAVKWTGFLNITKSGYYFMKYRLYDAFSFEAGTYCSLTSTSCGKHEEWFRCEFSGAALYQYTFKIAFHVNDPDVYLNLCYGNSADNCESQNIGYYSLISIVIYYLFYFK